MAPRWHRFCFSPPTWQHSRSNSVEAARQHKEKGAIILGSILWVIIVLLVIFWLFGAFVANLGSIVWLALVIAVILLIYNLLTRGRAEI